MLQSLATITAFEQALSTPLLHFKRLRQIEIVRHSNNRPIVRSTKNAFEAEIIWCGRRYLLFLPTRYEAIRHIEMLEETLRDRRQGPLINNQIFYEEITLFDSVGRKHLLDVIIQEIPEGMMLDKAVLHYKSEDLRKAVLLLKERLDSIDFLHRNLRPSNIVVCKSGVLRPLRYWHAEWKELSNNKIEPLIELIDKFASSESDRVKAPLISTTNIDDTTKPSFCGGITRKFKCGRYGFIDEDNRPLTKFIYSWASEFKEGRAIVANNGKMGAINNLGKKVVQAKYKSLEFDVQTGNFTGISNNTIYTLDYDGNIVHREIIKEK